MLTLHAAIATVLEIHRVPLCAKELADEINRRRLYIRRDRTLLRSSQIHARVKNYPALFEKSGGVITLYGHEIEMYTIEQGEKRDKRQ